MSCSESYDEARRPPAPKVAAELENPVTGRGLKTALYLDTGFDGTILLTSDLWEKLELGLAELDEDVYALHGGYLPVRLTPALARVSICGAWRGLVKVYLHPLARRALLGRGIVNRLYAYLAGPEGRLVVSRAPLGPGGPPGARNKCQKPGV
ncbi:hypothetical protein DRO33_02565 [Candidatus Bathyarchaeota archaeon]|nr:MAG: hypothetical protein DRO33_02565 [Candidatus Bathyarchaeota archaeon]